MRDKVSIKATFTLPSDSAGLELEQYFDAQNTKIEKIGLPDGVEPTKPEGGEFKYSGMHDHGALPKPKEGGDFAILVNLALEAKKNSDALLTTVIEKEKKEKSAPMDLRKKRKVTEDVHHVKT